MNSKAIIALSEDKKKNFEILDQLGGGRNSRVFKIRSDEGLTYVIKIYYQDRNDTRNRLKTEYTSLEFLRENGFDNIPSPLYLNPKFGFAVYEYICGKKISTENISEDHIEDAVRFLCDLKKVGQRLDVKKFGNASEAFYSCSDIISNIELRLKRLSISSRNGPLSQELQLFLNKKLIPAFANTCKSARWLFKEAFETKIQLKERTLSPSDFGFHNAIQKQNGKIVYVDFEYFGWDDPVKMISDFILHPGMQLKEQHKSLFLTKIVSEFRHSESFNIRFRGLFPLFVIKWCIILLNEFNSVDSKRRDFAQADNKNAYSIRLLQLEKSKLMLNEVNNNDIWADIIS